METLLHLNLNDEREKSETPNPPKPESTQQPSAEEELRLKRIAAKAAHKAATEYRRGGSNLFSK